MKMGKQNFGWNTCTDETAWRNIGVGGRILLKWILRK
jgi:hypothetical protein